MLVCALHVHAFVLNSSEHSGSQLCSSKQPSVAQLNPFPSHPHPPPLFLARQKDSCALQRAMFWVVEQGARPAQQLRLCIYISWLFHLFHWLWSDLYSCFTPWLSSDHFEFGFKFDSVVQDVCLRCRLYDLVWNGAVVCCLLLAQSLLLLAPYKHHHLLSVSAWGAASHLEHWKCENSPCFISARCRKGKTGLNVGRQQNRKAHYAPDLSELWREAVVWLEGFGPLHRSWICICYSGANNKAREVLNNLKDLVSLWTGYCL